MMTRLLKRLVAYAVAIVMLLSCSVVVFATETAQMDETNAGTITLGASHVTLTQSETEQNVDIYLYADKNINVSALTVYYATDAADEKIVLGTGVAGDGLSGSPTNEGMTVTNGNGAYMTYNGELGGYILCKVPVTIAANVTGTFNIEFTQIELYDAENGDGYSLSSDAVTATITVEEPSAPAADYTAGITADKTEINVDDTVTVSINVDGSAGSFATSQIKLSYDSTYLTFDAANANHVLNGASVSVNNGVITLVDHGAAQNNGVAYQLVFTGKAVTTEDTVVTLTNAAFDKAENAPVQNIKEIELDETTNKVNVTVVEERLTVDLSDDFDTDDGETVAPGGTFTFYAKNTNYTYTVTVNNGDITPEYDEDTGVWTITNVQADLTITATKEAKTFDVTINSEAHVDSNDGVGEDAATYKDDYIFTLKADTENYQYNLVSITIGGQAAPANSYSNNGKIYTIKGDYITGDIVITTEAVEIEEFTITGADGVLSASATTVKDGDEVTLTLTPVAGYKYEIKINGTTIPLDNNNQYTAAVTENWEIVVTESLDLSEENVSIATYLALNGKMIYMIQITTELDDGNVYAYNGTHMFWSEKYNENNGAYVFLAVVDNNAQAPTLGAIAANITITQGAAKSIDYSGNVNMADANTVDANDAQLVYNMYETKSYDGFVTNVDMEKYLRADVNGDGVINVTDAATIVNSILSAN